MDLQGTPIGKSTSGTKVTSNDPIQERPGPVTFDSLAGESARQGASFSQNRNTEPLSVSGSQSTFKNSNTSGAETIPSAARASDREKDSMEIYPDALDGQGSFPGTHLPESGYVGGSTQRKQELGIGGHQHQYNTSERFSG